MHRVHKRVYPSVQSSGAQAKCVKWMKRIAITYAQHEHKKFKNDEGKINNKYFINTVSIGIDAEVARNVSLMKKIKL